MKRSAALGLTIAMGVLIPVARGGHELPIYPSFYPHEIRIETIDAAAAGSGLADGTLHAFVGASPVFAGAPPETVRAVESLGSFVMVTLPAADSGDDCTALRGAARAAAAQPGVVAHPYPVTPFHADFLQHADLAEAAAQEVRLASPHADARIETVEAAALVADDLVDFVGWTGPPWIKSGWWQAWRLLGDALDPPHRQLAQEMVERLQARDYATSEDRLNLERGLVRLLTGQCRRMVAGYTLRREYFNAEYSTGIENIAFDSLSGLESPVFLRTVKLKDFPWNGWLRLGIARESRAAWNPVAGFTSPFDRLLWSALSDPAAFPEPYGDGWFLNRVADVRPAQ
ncbi:MAG: hypothetical protein ACHQAY_08145 [Hyphomicrobiales bacterium]